jgi:hypothetical protein
VVHTLHEGVLAFTAMVAVRASVFSALFAASGGATLFASAGQGVTVRIVYAHKIVAPASVVVSIPNVSGLHCRAWFPSAFE